MNINDVAEAAGVSRGSVSNYLNNKKVSDKIKLKIEAAIKELNYIPNSSARDLRSKESKFVVFIIPTVWSPFFSELTYYIQNELNSSGYKMILCISDSDFNKEKEYIELATSQKAAGIISISYSQMNDFVRPGMPLVSIEKEPTGRFSMVSSDNYEGGKLAAQKLIEKGAETLIYLGEKVIYSDAMSARKSGFVDYCNLNHVPYEIVEVSSIKNYENVKKDILSFLEENYNNETRISYTYNWQLTNNIPDVSFLLDKIHTKKDYKWTHPVHEVLENINQNETRKTIEKIVLNHFPDSSKSRSNYLSLLELSVKESPTSVTNVLSPNEMLVSLLLNLIISLLLYNVIVLASRRVPS